MAKPMQKGDSGAPVKRLQENLIALGFALPRFGADGGLGDETLSAVARFRAERGLLADPDDVPGTVPARIVEAIAAEAKALAERNRPANFVDVRGQHGRPGLSKSQPHRPWKQITGITLHQTAALIGEREASWFAVPIHVGITRRGKVIQLYSFTDRTNHAHNLNAGDVGIEIDGFFEGVEGDESTFWRPASDPNRKPLKPTAEQIAAAREAVRWICGVVNRFGGKLKFIHAHRQSSSERESDPGSRVWQEVGLWAQEELGLGDGGRRFTVGDGLPIPEAWDARYVGVRY
jgi:peptidoglycan hydrolase-like protein with peptidoglycan-binding domain